MLNDFDVLEYTVGRIQKGAKILISTLDSPFLDNDRVFPYLGILYLLSVAQAAGKKISFVKDLKKLNAAMLSGSDIFYTNLVETADLSVYRNFDLVCLSVLTPQGEEAKKLLAAIKSVNPEAIVVIGGPHAMYYLSECEAAGFDVIVRGDGERIFSAFLKGDLEWLRSCVLNKDNPASAVLCDILPEETMNYFPVPLRQKEYIGQYRYELNSIWATTMVNSRGCAMGCKFCEHRHTQGRWYLPEHFEQEVRSIIDMGINAIMIFDDLFALSSKVLRPYAEILKRYHKDMGLIYRCFGHARSIARDPHLVPMLAESGCVEVGFGAESGCQRILDAIGKNTTVDMNRQLIEICIKHGIKVKGFFMLGLPGEDHDSMKESMDFIRHYRKDFSETFDFDAVAFFPYKGTLIGNAMRLKEKEVIETAGDRFTAKTFNIRLIPELSWDEVDNHAYGAYKKKGGDSDLIIETYDHLAQKVLLSARQIRHYKEESLRYSKRYTDSSGMRIFTPPREGNV